MCYSCGMKRVSLMLKEEQYKEISDSGLNLSGLVRDLLDDHFSEHKITLSVSEETRKLYDLIVSNTGSTDEDVEKYLKDTLKLLLADRIQAMQDLQRDISDE
jgi:esterase/lipase